MITDLQNIIFTENYVISTDDYTQNLSSWKREKGHNILYITGHSGSGKSTTARKKEIKEKAIRIELDMFENSTDLFNPNWNLPKGHIIIRDYIKNKYGGDRPNWSLEKFCQEFNKFAAYLKKYANEHPDELFILEGLQIYSHMVSTIFSANDPLIIKGTSALKSLFRRKNRDSLSIPEGLKLIKWYFEQEKQIKSFKDKVILK